MVFVSVKFFTIATASHGPWTVRTPTSQSDEAQATGTRNIVSIQTEQQEGNIYPSGTQGEGGNSHDTSTGCLFGPVTETSNQSIGCVRCLRGVSVGGVAGGLGVLGVLAHSVLGAFSSCGSALRSLSPGSTSWPPVSHATGSDQVL